MHLCAELIWLSCSDLAVRILVVFAVKQLRIGNRSGWISRHSSLVRGVIELPPRQRSLGELDTGIGIDLELFKTRSQHRTANSVGSSALPCRRACLCNSRQIPSLKPFLFQKHFGTASRCSSRSVKGVAVHIETAATAEPSHDAHRVGICKNAQDFAIPRDLARVAA